MMKLKTSELNGAALDWAVAKSTGMTMDVALTGHYTYKPSTDWTEGGPIIDREKITWDGMAARIFVPERNCSICVYGPTHLIAAMRCYVASQLGNEVDVPIECLIHDHTPYEDQ